MRAYIIVVESYDVTNMEVLPIYLSEAFWVSFSRTEDLGGLVVDCSIILVPFLKGRLVMGRGEHHTQSSKASRSILVKSTNTSGATEVTGLIDDISPILLMIAEMRK